ncbi:MAG TPA: DUF2182 domain-containing protein [Longimicrobium sp.]|nr:DUF2182 domain-containing protein [Longimicrobium sp.]
MLAAASAAWVWMLALPDPQARAHSHAGHGTSGGHELLGLGLMVVGMMLPLTVPSVRYAAHSRLRRTNCAIAAFVAGYLAVWMAAMAVLAAAWQAVAALGGGTGAAIGMIAAAVLWEAAPPKRDALRRCRLTPPLAPRGWRADADCVRFGARTGARCVAACWALMAACVAFAHSLPVMAALFAIQLSGRYSRRASPALAAAAVLGVCLTALALRMP